MPCAHIAYYKEGEEKYLKLKKAAIRSISFLSSLSLQKVWGGNISMKNEKTVLIGEVGTSPSTNCELNVFICKHTL